MARKRFGTALLLFVLLGGGSAPAGSATQAAPVGTITTVAGGPAREGDARQIAQFPGKLLASGRSVLVTDMGNGVVRSINVDSGMATTVAGVGGHAQVAFGDRGPASQAQFAGPGAVARVSGVLYVADPAANVVRRIGKTGRITTLAGDGLQRFFGDGANARHASLHWPADLAHRDGYLYIVDRYNNRIRRVRLATGVIETYAGGRRGFAGDGGPARRARLDAPGAIEVAADGALLIADTGNHRIRRISRNGTITTVAGTGEPGDPGDDDLGDGSGEIGDGGPATSAVLSAPEGVTAAGDGGYFITDTEHHKIRRVRPSGTITTVAGTGRPGFGTDDVAATHTQLYAPQDVAVKDADELIIADTQAARVRIVGSDGIIRVLGGTYYANYSGGPDAGAAQLGYPVDVAVGPGGHVFIADSHHHMIRRVDPAQGTISRYAGNGGRTSKGDGGHAADASLGRVTGIDVDSAGNLYLAEQTRIRRIDWETRTISSVAGTGGVGLTGEQVPALAAGIRAHDLAVDEAGNIFFSERQESRVRKIDGDGVVTTAAGTGDSGYAGDGGPATQARLHAPHGVAVDDSGALYIADRANDRVRRVGTDGVITTVAGGGEPPGETTGDRGLASAARVYRPEGVAVAPSGALFVSEPFAGRIRRVDPETGRIATVAGNGMSAFSGDGGRADGAALNHPRGIAIDPAGALYAADWGNHRVRRVEGLTLPKHDPLPRRPGNVRVEGGFHKVILRWDEPAAADLAAVEVRTRMVFPPSRGEGLLVFNGRGTAVAVGGLPGGHRLEFTMHPRDARGAYGPGAGGRAYGSRVAIGVRDAVIRSGDPAVVTGRLTAPGFGPVVNRRVALQTRKVGAATWTTIRRVATNSRGRVSAAHRPRSTTEYRWRFGGMAEVDGGGGYSPAVIGAASAPAKVILQR